MAGSWSAALACRVDGVSACLRALAASLDALPCCCLSKWSLRAWTRRLVSPAASAQTTSLRMERWRKNLQKPATLIRLKTGLRAHLLVCAGAIDLHIAAGRPSCYFLAACEATRSADPLAGSTAALLVSALAAAPAPWRGRLMATRHGRCERQHERRHG